MATFKFFKINKSIVKPLNREDMERTMFAFVDVSAKILYDTTKAETEMLSLINSTISHEMRNPLNSIINECTIMQLLITNLLDLLSTIKMAS